MVLIVAWPLKNILVEMVPREKHPVHEQYLQRPL